MIPRRAAAARAAFTLIEMIVVLGIIMLLMGLVLAGVFSNRKIDRLVAAEQMIADVVRQARHAARSTGEPVVIEVRKETREVAGVSRTPIRCEQFESGTGLGVPVSGRTGNGLLLVGTSPWSSTLRPNERLERSASATHRSAGFYLACDVRTGQPADVTPLACVAQDTQGTFGSSACGIALVPVERNIEMSTSGGSIAKLVAWDIVGWVHTAAGETIVESEGDDLPRDRTDVLQNTFAPNGDLDVFGAMSGGAWEDLGLLYDGERLVLYRNGQRVAERAVVGVSATSPAHLVDADELVVGGLDGFIGKPTIQGGMSDAVSTNAGQPKIANNAIIDNVRLFRLTTDQAGTLPSGIAPKLDYRITAHPDGRVEVVDDATYATSTATPLPEEKQRLWFTGVQDVDSTAGGTLWGVITVLSDGRVSSEVRRLNGDNANQVVVP